MAALKKEMPPAGESMQAASSQAFRRPAVQPAATTGYAASGSSASRADWERKQIRREPQAEFYDRAAAPTALQDLIEAWPEIDPVTARTVCAAIMSRGQRRDANRMGNALCASAAGGGDAGKWPLMSGRTLLPGGTPCKASQRHRRIAAPPRRPSSRRAADRVTNVPGGHGRAEAGMSGGGVTLGVAMPILPPGSAQSECDSAWRSSRRLGTVPICLAESSGRLAMKVDWVIGKFLDNEALLGGGKAAVREVVAELEAEGVTVSASMVTNIQSVTGRVLAVQRERVAPHA